jgi:hypothetical protein
MQPIPLGLVFLVSFITGFLSFYIAKRKGLNPYTWFFCGFFFGLIGAILLYFLFPKKKEEKETIQIPVDPLANKIWYYLDQDMNQTGPMSYPALKRAWSEGVISNTTYIWNPDLDDWKTVEDILPKSTS